MICSSIPCSIPNILCFPCSTTLLRSSIRIIIHIFSSCLAHAFYLPFSISLNSLEHLFNALLSSEKDSGYCHPSLVPPNIVLTQNNLYNQYICKDIHVGMVQHTCTSSYEFMNVFYSASASYSTV